MTTKLEQAATMALEALSNIAFPVGDRRNEAVTALREALSEQAEQEPVAEVLVNDKDVIVLWHKTARQLGHQAKLYAAPVRTKDLTDDELNEVIETWATAYMNLNPDTAPDPDIYVARAIIATYKEKNK